MLRSPINIRTSPAWVLTIRLANGPTNVHVFDTFARAFRYAVAVKAPTNTLTLVRR